MDSRLTYGSFYSSPISNVTDYQRSDLASGEEGEVPASRRRLQYKYDEAEALAELGNSQRGSERATARC